MPAALSFRDVSCPNPPFLSDCFSHLFKAASIRKYTREEDVLHCRATATELQKILVASTPSVRESQLEHWLTKHIYFSLCNEYSDTEILLQFIIAQGFSIKKQSNHFVQVFLEWKTNKLTKIKSRFNFNLTRVCYCPFLKTGLGQKGCLFCSVWYFVCF